MYNFYSISYLEHYHVRTVGIKLPYSNYKDVAEMFLTLIDHSPFSFSKILKGRSKPIIVLEASLSICPGFASPAFFTSVRAMFHTSFRNIKNPIQCRRMGTLQWRNFPRLA